jgi:hypothetical protein
MANLKSTQNSTILLELLQKQNKTIIADKKLLYNDLKRISKYLNKSLFNDECSLWNGYITMIKHDEKNSYINFYFRKKKIALHRLLYINYIGELDESEYLKFYCANKGKCCNINHFGKNKNKEIKVNKKQIEDIVKINDVNIIVGFN